VESSCELSNEPSGSMKCWELPSGWTTCGLSSGTQLHRVSYLVSYVSTGNSRNNQRHGVERRTSTKQMIDEGSRTYEVIPLAHRTKESEMSGTVIGEFM
jgi:hypothetical protein